MYICDYDGDAGVLVHDVNSGTTEAMIYSASTFSTRKSSQNRCWYPQGIALDDHGSVYLTDLHRVLKYSSISEHRVAGVMSRPGSGASRFNYPSGITISGELVYVCDTENHRVLILNSRNLDIKGEFCHDDMQPIDIAIDKGGQFVYVLDCINKKVHIFQEGNHELLHAIDLTEPQYLKLQQPVGICVDTKHFVYVTDQQKHGVLIFDAAGNFKMFFGTRGSSEGEFNKPAGIDVDSQGNVYICDSGNKRVQIFS